MTILLLVAALICWIIGAFTETFHSTLQVNWVSLGLVFYALYLLVGAAPWRGFGRVQR